MARRGRPSGPGPKCKHCEQYLAWYHGPKRIKSDGTLSNGWVMVEIGRNENGTPIVTDAGKYVPRSPVTEHYTVCPGRTQEERQTTIRDDDETTDSATDPTDDRDDEDDEQDTDANGETVVFRRPTTGGAVQDAASALAAAIAAVSGKQALDRTEVTALVTEILDRRKETIEREIRITFKRDDGTSIKLDGPAHPRFLHLIAALSAGLHVYLFGPPGTGKTFAGSQAARVLGLEFLHLSLMPATPESRVSGYLDAHGVYRSTPWRDAYEHGKLFLFDELDNASDAILTSLNSSIENGSGAFPDSIIERHPAFRLIATGNTNGRGGTRNHAGRRSLDAATLDRFVFLPWGYDKSFETNIARARCGLPPKGSSEPHPLNPPGKVTDPAPWVRWIHSVRKVAAQRAPDLIVSARAIYNGLTLLSAGWTIEDTAEGVLWHGLDSATRDAILREAPMPAMTLAAV